jgi:hypothetical protein
MGISRSTYYDASIAARDDTAIVEAIAAICDEFECYGWRRVRAELRHRGMVCVRHAPRVMDGECAVVARLATRRRRSAR